MCVAPQSRHTPAARESLLAGVEGLIVAIVAEKCPPYLDRDDLMQECRLAVWRATADYDPARPFPKFAAATIRNVVGHAVADAGERYGRMPTLTFGDTTVAAAHAVADPRDPDAAPDPVADGWAEFRRSMTALGWAEVLERFPPRTRRLVALVAVDGLTPGQVADHLGQPVKVVRRNLQAACEVLARAGKVTPAVAAEAGVSDADVARWSVMRTCMSAADRQARRDLIAECGAGLTAPRLAGLLGCSPGQVQADRRAMARGTPAPRTLPSRRPAASGWPPPATCRPLCWPTGWGSA